MTLNNYGFIMLGVGFTPAQMTLLESPSFKMTVWGVETMDAAITAAQRMTADGVQLIELCGAFKGEMVTDIIAGIDGAVPVGHMAYDVSQRDKLMAFLAS